MTLMEPSDQVVLRGHNCKIEIAAGNTISHMTITGHNNKIYSKYSSNLGVIDRLEVAGHNNKIDSMIANKVKVSGHNNRFQMITCNSIEDGGICNQLINCTQQAANPQDQFR